MAGIQRKALNNRFIRTVDKPFPECTENGFAGVRLPGRGPPNHLLDAVSMPAPETCRSRGHHCHCECRTLEYLLGCDRHSRPRTGWPRIRSRRSPTATPLHSDVVLGQCRTADKSNEIPQFENYCAD